MKTAHELAQELLEIRDEMNVLKAAEKGIAEELRKLMKNGEKQDIFRFTESTVFKIADVAKVLKWAKKHAPQIITVNTTAARRVFMSHEALLGSLGTPEKAGFALVVSEQLREARGDKPESGYDVAE